MQASFVKSELHRNKLVSRANASIVASMHWFPKYNLKIKPACFKGWWFSSSARTKVTVLYITRYFWIFKGGTKILSICWTFLLWYKLTGSVKQWQAQRWVQQPPFGWDSHGTNHVDIREETLNFIPFHHLLTSNKQLFTQKACATKSVLEEIIHRNHYAVIDQFWFTLKPKQKASGAAIFCVKSTTEASEEKHLQPLHCGGGVGWGSGGVGVIEIHTACWII